jgi:hypothetical protein
MRTTPTNTTTPSSAALRSELQWLRTRYNYYTISPDIYAVIRSLEIDIAWLEHRHEVQS